MLFVVGQKNGFLVSDSASLPTQKDNRYLNIRHRYIITIKNKMQKKVKIICCNNAEILILLILLHHECGSCVCDFSITVFFSEFISHLFERNNLQNQ